MTTQDTSKLREQRSEVNEKLARYNKAIDALKEVMVLTKAHFYSEVIARLREQLKPVKAESERLTKAIVALQAVCTHEFKDDGHDSHHSYGRCMHCDLVEADV